jgi:hypothetical protein
MGMVALVLAALLLVAVLSSVLPGGVPGDAPTPTPPPTPSATPVPSPTPFNIDALSPPIAEEVRKWWEDCGTEGEAPPFDVSGMNKKQVEDRFKPLREACKEQEEDG